MKNRLFKKVALLGLGLVMMAGLAGCGSEKKAANEYGTTKEGVVVVGFDNTFVPMGFLDKDNNVVGFDVELAKAVFDKIGLKPEFKNIDWSMKEQDLRNGNIDCIWNGYSINDQRKKQVLFSDPYLNNSQIVVTLANEPYKNIMDLKDQPVGTQEGSATVDAIDKDTKFKDIIKDKKPVTYATFDQALRDLQIGRIKAVAGDEVLLKYYIKQRGAEKYKILDGVLDKEEYGVAFRKDEKKLQEAVNKALKELKEDGTFEKIEKKWFD